MKLGKDELPYELTDEYLDGIADDDEGDGEEDCGRWRNGKLVTSCLSAGTEWCDWDCPIGPHRHRKAHRLALRKEAPDA